MRYVEDQWDELDDMYDSTPTKNVRTKMTDEIAKHKPVNTRMAFLNRQAGIINRYRKQGIL
jgi:hypothetical protein